MVTSSLQTSAGRMLFGRVDGAAAAGRNVRGRRPEGPRGATRPNGGASAGEGAEPQPPAGAGPQTNSNGGQEG